MARLLRTCSSLSSKSKTCYSFKFYSSKSDSDSEKSKYIVFANKKRKDGVAEQNEEKASNKNEDTSSLKEPIETLSNVKTASKPTKPAKKAAGSKFTGKISTEAINKLNTLLQQMVQDDVNKPKLNLAKPRQQKPLKREPGVKEVKAEVVDEKIVSAVKDVAEVIKGDKKQIESELLSKLLNGTAEAQQASSSLSDIVKGMKIDREVKTGEVQSRAQQVRQILSQHQKSPHREFPSKPRGPRVPQRRARADADEIVYSEPVDIWGAEPLNIFTNKDKFDDVKQTENVTWKKLQERELKLSATHPPSNYFQEQIQWTEQGMIWKFPIDNEQGLENERNVYFAEHVFMEKHIEDWCPKRGPVRHFMELVCVGLSKNPYMTVETKKGHIEWYKNYFLDKIDLLKEVGAVPVEAKAPKQLESE